MFSPFKDNVVKYINEHYIAVLATSDEIGQPASSTIFYVSDTNLSIRFITKTETAKYINLQSNIRAAMTIYNESQPKAVDLIGTVSEITDQRIHDETMQEIFEIARTKLDDYAPIFKLHKGSYVAMTFTPTQAKLSDFSKTSSEAHTETYDY